MQRIPEPELMTSSEQVSAYAQADFSELTTLFSSWVLDRVPAAHAPCVDLGYGPGDIVCRLTAADHDRFAGVRHLLHQRSQVSARVAAGCFANYIDESGTVILCRSRPSGQKAELKPLRHPRRPAQRPILQIALPAPPAGPR